jgi:hypothetical protein
MHTHVLTFKCSLVDVPDCGQLGQETQEACRIGKAGGAFQNQREQSA